MNEMTAGQGRLACDHHDHFRNYQWGAEKRNTTLWYSDNFVGTELDLQVSYADIAKACGVKGVQAKSMDELTQVLEKAVQEQMNDGVTTFIEVILIRSLENLSEEMPWKLR